MAHRSTGGRRFASMVLNALAVSMVGALVGSACSSSSSGSPAVSSPTPRATTPTTMVAFEPRTPSTPVDYLPQPRGVPWPDPEWPTGPLPAGVSKAALDAQLDRDFGELSQGRNTTDAVLVVQGGRIVVERYRPGFGGRDTPHHSWSMAKSITSTLVGMLVADGKLDIYAPAPVPQWSDPKDPRHAITTDELLRMASGLKWNEDYFASDSDVTAMIWGKGKGDMAAYAANKPLVDEPNTVVAYSTGTSNIVAGIIGRIVGRGAPTKRFVRQRLLDPLGIDPAHTDIAYDGAGQLVGGSIFDLTARDYARLGLLYDRGGMWSGRRLLPEGWVDYSRTPTPPPRGWGKYGAHWWTYEDCQDGFRMGGFNGQHVVVCPTLDLVVVVLSNRVDQKDGLVRDDLVHLFRDAALAQGATATTAAGGG